MTSPGDMFGPYRIIGRLGSGGMGEVLRAHDTEHDREVALKVLSTQWAADTTYRERFRREARIVARLREPHVIPIHRYGEIENRLFLDMRLVEGQDLAALLSRTGPLEPARAVDLIGQVARALDAAHADGLVHRDVKPSNVLLIGRADGGDLAENRPGEDFAYLVDFGIARSAEDETGPSLTGTGLALGSTDYMAPERFTREPLDGRADVYSLACTLFELLTGRRPFAGPGPVEHMYAHLQEQPPAPSSLRPELPDLLDAVVLRGLAKDRADRWTSAGGMAAAARAALSVSGVEVPRPAETGTAPTLTGMPIGDDDGRPVTRQVPVAPVQRPTIAQPQQPQQALPLAPQGSLPPPPWQSGAPAPQPFQPQYVPAGTAPPRTRRWGRWVLTVTAVLVAVLVIAGLGVLLRRADDRADTAEQRLLTSGLAEDVVPADCEPADPTDAGLSVLQCGPSVSSGGPTAATYTLYSSASAATAQFSDEVDRLALPRLEDDRPFGCGDDDGFENGGWAEVRTISDDALVGRFACSVQDGDTVVTWTIDRLGVIGRAELNGQGADGFSSLVSWWTSNGEPER